MIKHILTISNFYNTSVIEFDSKKKLKRWLKSNKWRYKNGYFIKGIKKAVINTMDLQDNYI